MKRSQSSSWQRNGHKVNALRMYADYVKIVVFNQITEKTRMPINKSNPNGTVRTDIAERLQILNLSQAKENVKKMKIEAYFNTSIHLGDEKLSEAWNPEVLTFDCVDDPELEAAMTVIQTRIGQKRYEQITAPPEIPESVESPGMLPIEGS